MTSVSFRAFALAVVGLACSDLAAAGGTLFERLGGQSGIAAIADRLVDRVAADPLTGPVFEDVNLANLKRLLGEQVCELSDGPCRYSGASMKRAHAGLNISQAQFYRMVDSLRDVLGDLHVDQRSKNELLRWLAPMKRDIVEHAPAKRPATAFGADPDGAASQ